MRLLVALFALTTLSAARPVLVDRSIFDKTEIISSTKFINAPVDKVVATLHDFEAMIRLNPLVTSLERDAEDPNRFTITDSLPLFLGLAVPTTYTAVFETVENGMNTDNSASAGVSLHNEWRAVAHPNGGTDLTETDTLTANFLLAPIVKDQLTTSHNQLMEALAVKIESGQ